MLRKFFTMTDLLTERGIDPTLARNPSVTKPIAQQLIMLGYTQKIIKEHGVVERLWSKEWYSHRNQNIAKGLDYSDIVRRAVEGL